MVGEEEEGEREEELVIASTRSLGEVPLENAELAEMKEDLRRVEDSLAVINRQAEEEEQVGVVW